MGRRLRVHTHAHTLSRARARRRYIDANFRDRTAVEVCPIGVFDDWQVRECARACA